MIGWPRHHLTRTPSRGPGGSNLCKWEFTYRLNAACVTTVAGIR